MTPVVLGYGDDGTGFDLWILSKVIAVFRVSYCTAVLCSRCLEENHILACSWLELIFDWNDLQYSAVT